jgi:hypothetical protein
MVKAVAGLAISLGSLLVSMAFAPNAVAQEGVAPATDAELATGICGLYDRSGYLVVDQAGRLVDTVEYCQQQPPRSSPEPGAEAAAVDFWQVFAATANAEARQLATALGTEEVLSYGTTICPFLQQGGTLQALRQVQGDGELPSNFEIAVTVAAIHTYCPTYQSELGR